MASFEPSGVQRFLRAGPLTWLLAGLCGWALLFWLATLLGLGTRPGEASVPAAEALPAPAGVQADRIGPLAQYSEAAARPLFTADRKPHAFLATGPEDGEAGAGASSLDIILTGVLISPAVRLAIVQPSAGGASQRVRVGSSPEGAAGWRLLDVQPRRAIFEGPSGQMTLDLRTFGVAATPAGVAKAAADAAAAAAERAEAAAAGPPLPPPTPDEAKRISEIRKRIEARRAQLQSGAASSPPPPPPPPLSRSTNSRSQAPSSTQPVLQQVTE
jgi:general secretion pathway protein N